ncbi:hypothetical protein AVEN_222131-1, partial [Araneus ventricosus]
MKKSTHRLGCRYYLAGCFKMLFNFSKSYRPNFEDTEVHTDPAYPKVCKTTS